ncbi:MAG: citramalate synthase [Candidatus Poribacteria bacterium]|nr:citramalate synthase [Candidatus Poribacteria bacterium]
MVELYDTTLRDGSQGEDVAFSVEDKLLIIQALDQLGIHYIEGGYPGSNPKDVDFFKQAKALELQHAEVVPFGSTHHPRYQPSEDPNLLALLDTGARTVTIFGKSWKLHATDVLRVTAEENIELIESSVRFLVDNGREVIYDAEHFFDGYDDDPDYALQTLWAAVRSGARCLVLCDTNGGRLPLEVQDGVRAVRAALDLPIGIHTHNDAGMGVANSVLAVQAGATHVQGTFNGYGERCGNANLAAIIPTLKLKLGINCISDDQLRQVTDTSRLISELANLPHDERQPYVGKSAFAHKGGMHIDAVRKNRLTFEHIVPELVGNEQRILISDQAGKSAIAKKIEKAYPNYDKNSPEVTALFDRLKVAESEGYQYEAAEASFDLLTHKVFNGYQPFFNLVGFRVIIEKFTDHSMRSEATVKVMEPNGVEEHTAADGDGPVNALDNALRKALERFYPSLQEVYLTDYKVRVLDTKAGTGAKVRVLLEASDGQDHWGTVGVSENIIQASWEALADSLEYKLYKDSRGGATGT